MKFSVGDLVYKYPSGKHLNYQYHAGIVEEVPPAGVPADESHAKIRLINGNCEWVDVGRYGAAGTPYHRVGRVIVKWLRAHDLQGETLDEVSDLIGQHVEWHAEMFTDSGWALARDPFGEQHWLPPRRRPGVDSIYIFYRGTGQDTRRYVVTMQQTGLTVA